MWRWTVMDIYLTATFTDTKVNNLVCNTQIIKHKLSYMELVFDWHKASHLGNAEHHALEARLP